MWTWINKAIFEEGFQCSNNPTYVIQNLIRVIEDVFENHLYNNPQHRKSCTSDGRDHRMVA